MQVFEMKAEIWIVGAQLNYVFCTRSVRDFRGVRRCF